MVVHRVKTMFNGSASGSMLLLGILTGSLCVMPTSAQSSQEQGQHVTAQAPAPPVERKTSPYRPGVPDSAKEYYQTIWGVDNMLVRQMASGNLIRFSYRVIDPVRAKALGDKRATPLLYGQRSRALLHIPVMDKVGQLRQTGTAEAGKEYWMVFSNKGNVVKPGDNVNVIIGLFNAEGLVVE